MEQRYLLKIQFDCNDADYIYGLQVIDQKQKDLIDRNLDREVGFGPYDFSGGHERPLKYSIKITEITDEDYVFFKKHGLLEFGEGNNYWLEYLEEEEEFDEDDD
jgi:hypothetical protein